VKVLVGVGAERIRADTDAINTPMIRAFHDVGFREIGTTLVLG